MSADVLDQLDRLSADEVAEAMRQAEDRARLLRSVLTAKRRAERQREQYRQWDEEERQPAGR